MQLPKVYEPSKYESDIYALWEKSGAFEPKNRGNSDKYSIVLPPPNANGDLHVGHGLMFAIQDLIIRYHRMKGEAVLWLPGADHAGFETQVVYEKQLAKEGKSRFDFKREELYQQIWDFVAQNRDNYSSQFRRLGASVDWSRYVYTLDDKIVKRAYATFKKMWDEGLIYRGERLVNFCTFHGTGFADIEVDYKEVTGHLYYLKYPLTDGGGEVVVATTRPETMLGDTAVAVHPADERYKKFIGKTIKLPLTQREIPIIADDMVDKEFGTGAVKITPAHDPNDYEVAGRHDLPMITVISHEGKMTHEVPKTYQNMEVDEARKLIVNDLKDLGVLEKVEDHSHSVGHCYKCGTVIQPLLRDQWFIDVKPLASDAIKALRDQKIKFYPDSKRTQLISYFKELRDWNISRQIAWGIPIPAFQNIEDPEDWIYDERVGKEFVEIDGKKYRRDPDVFDTWFSSSSWPYATLDYPDSEDFKSFYPNSLMETGGEILYPWVSRMIMFGLYVTGEIPFKEVYIHGYVLATDGAKMSKSVGNVVNPMTIIDSYGSDALRMGLIDGRTAAVNRPFDESKVVAARNFANKLWNIARFVEDKIGDDPLASGELKTDPKPETSADYWILNNLQQLTERVTALLEEYRFAEAYEALYHFVWDDFADWYLEVSKTSLNKSVLAYGLETILKLAHPFAPFVTETIWQTLKWEKDSLLITSEWPKARGVDETRAKDFEDVKTIVSEIRLIRSIVHVAELNLYHRHENFLVTNAELIKSLAKLQSVTDVRDGSGLHLTTTKYDGWLDIDQRTAHLFVEKLEEKKAEEEKLVAQLEARLANASYVKNAPKEVVDETKEQLTEAKERLAIVSDEHGRFASAQR